MKETQTEKMKNSIFYSFFEKYSRFCLIFVLFLLFALLFANSSKWYFRKDFSRDKLYTLSPFTKELLDTLGEKVQITYYVSEKLQNLYPQTKDITEYLKAYANYSRQISLKIVDPQKDGSASMLEQMGIQPQQLQSSSQDETSLLTVFSAIVVEYSGKNESIPFLLSTSGLEFDLDSRIQYMATGKQRRAAVIIGNGQDINETYPYLLPWLQSAGFVTGEILPKQLPLIDAGTPLLIIGSNAFDDDDIFEIESHIMAGANAAVFTSPNSVNAFSDWQAQTDKNTKFLQLLDFWGIKIQNELVLDISNYRLTMQSPTSEGGTYNEYLNYPFWLVVKNPQNTALAHSLAAAFYGAELYWPSPLQLFETEELKIEPFLKTSPAAWLMPQPFDTDPFSNKGAGSGTKSEHILAASAQGIVNGFYTTGKSQPVKLFVCGDQFLPSKMIEYTNSPNNLDFVTSVMLFLNGEDELLQIRSKGMRSNSLEKISEKDEFAKAKNCTLFDCIILPCLAVAIIWALTGILRHKRKFL